ncbi:MAG: bifunctional 2-C-methyl-D-erythritol 4-phosphate cytidylyltransferase/2-C-methyl-D-erythritol 2,4-cyclodiphosphate synthase [Paracoccaceae bacterium]
MTTAALIVAAGRGTRAGGGMPKQWQELAGQRVFDWTLQKFQTAPSVGPIVVVLSQDDWEQSTALTEAGVICAVGGEDRAASVRNGLRALENLGVTRVLIHDAARPCVPVDLIEAVATALDTAPAVAPGLPVTDALWTGADDHVTGTQDRAGLFAAQTPQGFHYDLITAAHAAQSGPALDDVEVARAYGAQVAILPGAPDNLKITTPDDFARAARILGAHMDIRTGTGFDVHRFEDGDHVILCGVRIPHDRKLKGHSDADVGMHAVTDAIYGAMAEGDIGRHFPPSDPQWKGADSAVFLHHAAELARSNGFTITNVDCTLICEYPKVGPHADAMQARMAEIMGMEAGRVSIKATTSERLGFTGRGEGIAAQAIATLVRS